MKHKFLIKSVFIMVYLTTCIASSYANEKKETTSNFSTFFELGEKFTDVFGYENSDVVDDIMYQRYSISLNQKVTPAVSYTVGQLIERRNYDNNDQYDNMFMQTTASMKYKLPGSGSFIMPQELRATYMHKYKNYVHTVSGAANDDYDQNKFSLGVSYIGDKEDWRIDYDTGVNSFDYDHVSSKDEEKYFNQIQLKKKLFDKKLDIFAGYKIQFANRRIGDDRTEPEEVVGFDLKPGLKNLSLISFKFENGKSETREEDAREDEYDFEYDRMTTKIEIPLTSKLKNTFVHKTSHRKYLNFNKSYHYLSLGNTIRFTQVDDKTKTLYYELALEDKESDFILSDPSNYKKIAETFSITYDRKKDWKVKNGFTFRRKEFSAGVSEKNYKQYIYNLGFEKMFTSDLSLAFDLRKEWKDYYKGPGDKALDVYKISLNYRF